MNKERVELFRNEKKKQPAGSTPCGITWVDGRIVFKDGKKHSKFWFGICNWSGAICMIAPLDFERVTMISTIRVNTNEMYCERAHTCLFFDCILNKFNKDMFVSEFEDCSFFSLGLPQDIGRKPLWFNNTQDWRDFWKKLVIPVQGGIIRFDEEKAKEVISY